MKTFALIGAAGYIAPRHMEAIQATGNTLVAAYDKHDSVGILDRYFPDAAFFTEFERFDRHLEKLRQNGEQVDFVSICSPNYLHDAHIRFALRIGANAICEKPMVLNPWNVEALASIEKESIGRIYNILQLRLHPSVMALKEKVQSMPDKIWDIKLDYITSRGQWYLHSWKGDMSKSGGIATNIGVHFFDMLIWIFGRVQEMQVNNHEDTDASGVMKLEKANVNWHLSIDAEKLPKECADSGQRTFRALTIDEEQFEFSQGFTDLHIQSYQDILSGKGVGVMEALPSIEVVEKIRTSDGRR
jgi:UDP-N-acetyl-2-amino-2-deoxyglucuronate dehydrogenase